MPGILRETEDGGRAHFIAGPQDCGRELRLVGAVGKMLRFQRQPGARLDDVSVTVAAVALHIVGGIDLDAGLGGQNLQHGVVGRVMQARRKLWLGAATVQLVLDLAQRNTEVTIPFLLNCRFKSIA